MNAKLTFPSAVIVAALSATASAQVFSDDFGDSSKYTIAGDGDSGTVEDVRYNFDYGNFDIFGDGFITGGLPEAPNSDAGDTATTGIFISANNDSQQATSLFTGIYANNVEVGAGTATEDYVLRFDSYNMVATGIDGDGPPRATNYQWAGVNFTPDEVPASDGEVGPYNGPFGAGTSGQTLAITGEQGAFDDYEVTIGGTTIEDRAEGFTGLATAHIEQQFLDNGFTPGPTNIDDNGTPDDTTDDIVNQTPPSPFPVSHADDGYPTPIPGQEDQFFLGDSDAPLDEATVQRFWREQFPQQTGAPPYDATNEPFGGSDINENDNDALTGGTPYNRWTSHEIYFVDGVWTHVIDGVPVLQVDPSQAGDGSQTVTESGTFGLGFLDGFSSFNDTPEGSNAAFYDNIVLEEALPSDVPDMLQFLEDNGYIPEIADLLLGDLDGDGDVDGVDIDPFVQILSGNLPYDPAGDFDGDGDVDGVDIDPFVGALSGSGMATSALTSLAVVPEPTTLVLFGLGGLAALGRRHRTR